MIISLETITPAYAAELLKVNSNNRPIQKNHASSIAGAITRGEWKLNGDAIRISKEGVLLDGQHRLTGVVIAGKEVEMMVVRGLDSSVFNTIDTGSKPRSAGDVLAISGVLNYRAVASCARMLFIYNSTGNPFYSSAVAAPTVQQIEQFIAENPEIHDAVRLGRASLKSLSKIIPERLLTTCFFIFSKQDKEKAISFFKELTDGAGLDQDSVVLRLRNRLLSSALDQNKKIPTEYIGALMFKSFKLYMAGKSVKTLRVAEYEKDVFKF